ncbi:NlpC/P60 family protein (plasmid) [Citricoccus nitrophenolicus]
MAVEAIESRIIQIQSTLQSLSNGPNSAPLATTPTSAGSAVAGAGSGAATEDSFAEVLDQVMTANQAPGAVANAPGSSSAGSTAGTSEVFSASGTSSAAGSASGNTIVEAAKKHLGTPYVWGGNSPSQGFDCSGLVKYVMKELGVDMPRVARDQAKVGTEIGSLAEAQPGDLLGMRNGKHIAIYLGDNKILHAPQPGENVSIRSLFAHDDIDTIRRVAPAGGSGASAGELASRAAFEAVSS